MTLAALPQTEASFQAAVVEYARLNGWLCYHTYRSTRSAPGFPDLVLVRDGHLVFAELKTERGRLSAAQDEWLSALAEVAFDASPEGIVDVATWRPSDWPRIERLLGRGRSVA